MILGAVGGWLAEEYAALGVPFADRAARLEEAIALMRHCWETEQPSWAGKYWAFPPLHFQPKPVQRPFPVWFGGHSRKARHRAATLGDGWHGSYLSPEEMGPLVKELRQFRADSPRKDIPFTIHVHPHWVEQTDATLRELIPAYEDVGVDVMMVDALSIGTTPDIIRVIDRAAKYIS